MRSARIGLAVLVLVGLDVEVLATHGAQAGAPGPAEDLVRNLERDGVPSPRRHVKLVVGDVVGPELVPGPGIGIVELAGGHVGAHLGVPEAAHAGADEASLDSKVDHRRVPRLRQLELGRDGGGARLVALAAEQERLEVDVEPLGPHLAGAKAQSSEVEHLHERSVAPRDGIAPIRRTAAPVPFDHGD